MPTPITDELYEKVRCFENEEQAMDACATMRDKCREFERENAKLREAIRLTLEENAHLADGENCTLRCLKTAI